MGNRLTNQELLNQNQKIDDRLHQLREANKTLRTQQSNDFRSNLWTGVKWGFKGFGKIAESISTPNSNRRMKIAQLPAKRSDMDIVRKADVKMLKDPHLRNRDIRGRLIK